MIAAVWLCDATIVDDRRQDVAYPCPATSRAAPAEVTLGLVASSDGWVHMSDGTHRCPFHAGATT